MRIFLLGGEQPTLRRLMRDAGAARVGLSFHSLYPRLPKRKEFLLAEAFDVPPQEVYVASGGYAFAKKASESQSQAFLSAFEYWVENNAAQIALCSEYDGPLSPVERAVHRTRMQAMLGDKFAPVWDSSTGVQGLEALAAAHTTVAVRGEDARENRALSSKMMPLTNRLGTRWHALDGAKPDDLFTGRFSSAATTGWLSPMRFGETIVWDGTRMVRYQKKMKDQARRRHRSTFRQAGFDAEAILNDDNQEISRFTVWSYARLEEAVIKRGKPLTNPFSDALDTSAAPEEEMSTFSGWNEERGDAERPSSDVDILPAEVGNRVQLPAVRSERQIMPVAAFEIKTSTEHDNDGNQVIVERKLYRKSNTPLRQCDTCHIAATCLGFQPASECAYDLPIEIKTKDQILAVNYAMLEMQVERIAFMRMAEEQSGGYADPNLSLEMDRLFRIQEQIKKIEDNAEYVKLNIEARGGAGVLSRLLGESATKAKELQHVEPMVALPAYVDAEIVDVE